MPSSEQRFDLAGVLIWTSAERFDDMRAFYVEVLGLEPRSDRHEFVNFVLGASRLSIAVHDHVAGVSSEPDRIMLNLGTTDIQKDADRLASLGVSFVREPEQESWGGWVATFYDPDGNAIQLMQQP